LLLGIRALWREQERQTAGAGLIKPTYRNTP